MPKVSVSPYLRVWTVISLRTAAEQPAVRRAIEARGARALALPALRLAPPADIEAARGDLRLALAREAVIFTSPAAVRYATRLLPLDLQPSQTVLAVGAGTALLLRRHGVDAIHPGAGAMHSEGLLALPGLAAVARVGLITAPGGRGLLLPSLQARAIDVQVAHVYRRVPPRLGPRHFEGLQNSIPPRALLLSSAEALHNAMLALPPAARACLLDAVAIAGSARLARIAADCGIRAVIVADAPDTESLLDALAAHAKRVAIR